MLKMTEFKMRDSQERRNHKTRIYVWAKDENVMENLANRFSRPYKMYKKFAIPMVLEEMGLDPKTRVRWSQKAGCSCGCSPAFIIEDSAHYNREVFVTVEPIDPSTNVRVDPETADIAADRQLQLGMTTPDYSMAHAISQGKV